MNVFTLTGICLAMIASTTTTATETSQPVRTGLEVLLADRIELIQGKSVGIVTNHTGVDSKGRSIVDLVAEKSHVAAVFGPEHGYRGDAPDGLAIQNEAEQKGPAVYSLYGSYYGPTTAMLQGVDVMLFDIQDVGAKFYTYISTLYFVMEACARENIPLLVLDRPNPITGLHVEGPVTRPSFSSFVGIAPLPIRHGMTLGELAMAFNQAGFMGYAIGANLQVVRCENWKRDQWYDETGLPWINPSPNMPSLEAATVYPGTCLVEGTNLSEGRGTEIPFLLLGAPWIDGEQWAGELNQQELAGITFEATRFTPVAMPGKDPHPKHQDTECGGIRIHVTDRNVLTPVAAGVAILATARAHNPEQFQIRSTHLDRLWGSQRLREKLETGANWRSIMKETELERDRFVAYRKMFLLYPESER